MAMRRSDQAFLIQKLTKLETIVRYMKLQEEIEALRNGEELFWPDGYSQLAQTIQSVFDDIVLRIFVHGDGQFQTRMRKNGEEMMSPFGERVLQAQERCPHNQKIFNRIDGSVFCSICRKVTKEPISQTAENALS